MGCLWNMTEASRIILIPQAPHDFFGACASRQQPEQMKCAYAESAEPWGFRRAVDWLSQTASPSKAIIWPEADPTDCVDLPVTHTSECGENIDAAFDLKWKIYLGRFLMYLASIPVNFLFKSLILSSFCFVGG